MMSEVSRRLGVLYGKLGLATDPALIERRIAGADAVATAISVDQIPDLVRCVLRLPNVRGTFLAGFVPSDPTFSVQAEDAEARLLAAGVAGRVLEERTDSSSVLALSLVVGAFLETRQPPADNQLPVQCETFLANMQGEAYAMPAERKAVKSPKALNEAVQFLTQAAATNQFAQIQPHVTTIAKELTAYTDSVSQAAARTDNALLEYMQQLHEEMGTYWWVVGGWSKDAGKPYKKMSMAEASVRAAKELAEKTSAPLGLFAAPALLELVLERGRETAAKNISIVAAATSTPASWREQFIQVGTGPNADLTPLCSAMGLAASSADAADWIPRFERLTQIKAEREFAPSDLAFQLYREIHLINAFEH
jgi:hypothetical protein